MVEAAKKSTVPVCVHLDHGETLEYLKKHLLWDLQPLCMMVRHFLMKKIWQTQRKQLHGSKDRASVEAELGSMGRRESGAGDDTGAGDETKIYTDPKQAAVFVKETGIDALACSFGTTHGIYLTEPKLDFDVVKNVRANTNNIPVVMHGGSGVSKEDYKKAIEAGVRKVNYFTYMDKSGGNAVAEYLKSLKTDEPIFFSSISMVGRDAMKENVKDAMKMFALMN